MKNRREFLAGCAAVAAATMAMPAAGAILGADGPGNSDDYGLDAFKSLTGERIPLREGGSVVLAEIETIKAEARCEQFVVNMVPSTRMATGRYHLETAEGTRRLYLEAGGSARRPTLLAAVSRLRV